MRQASHVAAIALNPTPERLRQNLFEGDSIATICTQVLHTEPSSLAELKPGLPEDLVVSVHRCLAKKLEDRYQDLAEMADDLVPFGGAKAAERRDRIFAFLAKKPAASKPEDENDTCSSQPNANDGNEADEPSPLVDIDDAVSSRERVGNASSDTSAAAGAALPSSSRGSVRTVIGATALLSIGLLVGWLLLGRGTEPALGPSAASVRPAKTTTPRAVSDARTTTVTAAAPAATSSGSNTGSSDRTPFKATITTRRGPTSKPAVSSTPTKSPSTPAMTATKPTNQEEDLFGDRVY